MTNLVNSLVEALDAGLNEEVADEVLGQVGFMFEKSHGWGKHLTEEEKARSFGWPPEVSATTITKQDFRNLRDALIDFIRRRLRNRVPASAIWALSKTFDPTTKPILLELLEVYVDGDSDILFQTMIALHNLEEDIFLDIEGCSSLDVEKNRVLGKSYLQRQKKL